MWQGIVAVAAVTLALWAEPIWHYATGHKLVTPISIYVPGGYPWSPVCKHGQIPIARECVIERSI